MMNFNASEFTQRDDFCGVRIFVCMCHLSTVGDFWTGWNKESSAGVHFMVCGNKRRQANAHREQVDSPHS